jgi:transcriptional regulator with PAS, ATPase and Fis domain
LNVLEINLPPLIERIQDLPLLIETLIFRINLKIGSDAQGVTPEALTIMKGYNWPGNVRELENLLEQAINWSDDSLIDLNNIPVKPWEKGTSNTNDDNNKKNYHEFIEETEKGLIIDALDKANGNKAEAARLLNMQRSVLYKKLERLNI